MSIFNLKEISNDNIIKELTSIGFDENYKYVAVDKFKYKNIKIFNLSLAQANILKQTALTVGADFAVNKNVITGEVKTTDGILCGSHSQLKKIAEKLKKQPFKLPQLAQDIKTFLVESVTPTKLVGILNITPDSFSDGGMYYDIKNAQEHLIRMIQDGADIIDIGAETTKPHSAATDFQVQIQRLKPILEFINKENIKIPISIDTRSSQVADFCLNNGATIINDVSGFEYDEKMANIISSYNATVIIQHSLGSPDVMQNNPKYNNLIEDIYFYLQNKIEFAQSLGIHNIIVDPGIGFGKTVNDNFQIINRIEEFKSLNIPIMVGLSRKSMLGINTSNNDLKDSLSAILAYQLMLKNISYLRVHNVSLHKKAQSFLKYIPS